MQNTERMPVLFIGHGTPMNAIESNQWTEGWTDLGRACPDSKAILSISAHWLTNGGSPVTANDAPKMNYDMYGFPALNSTNPTVQLLAILIGQKKSPIDRRHSGLRAQWGFDHGTWVVLAPVPTSGYSVLQLSDGP
jgi:4,5-DOPA dioxygenase extradiol